MERRNLIPGVVYSTVTGEILLWGAYDPAQPRIFYGGWFNLIDLNQVQWLDCEVQEDQGQFDY